MRRNLNYKSGMTLASIVLYVSLFFVFSVFAISLSSNMNMKALSEKGNIIVNEEYQKLSYNILKSAKESTDFNEIGNKIVFSNNDEYIFDSNKGTIYKNGGILIKDVIKFDKINVTNISGLPTNYTDNIDKNINSLAFDLTLKKYSQEKKFQIFLTLGV